MKKYRYIIFVICIIIYFLAIYSFASLASSISEILKTEGETTGFISIMPVVVSLSVFYLAASILMLYGMTRVESKKFVSRTIWISIIILAAVFYFLNSDPIYSLMVLTTIITIFIQGNIHLFSRD